MKSHESDELEKAVAAQKAVSNGILSLALSTDSSREAGAETFRAAADMLNELANELESR